VGATRPTVTITLNKLKQMGVLASAGRKLVVVDLVALEAMLTTSP
jgi:hypothetical protein